jgi:hypothetical protein
MNIDTRCQITWDTCYPERRKWADLEESARAEWREIFSVFLMAAPQEDSLRKDIENAINRHSAENGSDTPDFILAEYLTDCLAAYDRAVCAREKWHGREPVAVTDLPIKFRAGDEVHHTPSGENWTLAGDEENGKVQPCGWPESMAQAKDCRRLKPATDEERMEMLRSWSEEGKGYEHERDSRTHVARRQLRAENSPSPTKNL